MAINLKQIPPPVPQPDLPKWWIWLLLLIGGFLAGTAWAILNNQGKSVINAAEFWETALVFPALIWLILLMLRIVWYRGLEATADGSNETRERILQQEIRRGRRSLSVLGVSMRSALREPGDEDGQIQKKALQEKAQALKTQASWQSDEGCRHSRLIRIDDETPEQLLSRELSHTLEELSQVLATFPADMPLTLLLENNSRLPEFEIQAIWQRSWAAIQVRQPVTYIQGTGLEVVDRWLDNNINDPAMLMVVAFQLEPEQVEGTAEAVVGVLLRTRTQSTVGLPPLATLHRPERVSGMTDQDFQYALERAYDWVPVPAEIVSGGWVVGTNAKWDKVIATGLIGLSSPINTGQDLHNLDSNLGYPGPAAPWFAIACAAEQMSNGEPQLIISGEGTGDKTVWVTLVTSAAELQS